MPCGGIFPTTPGDCACFHCNKKDPPPDHFVLEWDAFIHGTCVEAFLTTQEGKIVLGHKHEVVVAGPDGVERTLYEEGKA